MRNVLLHPDQSLVVPVGIEVRDIETANMIKSDVVHIVTLNSTRNVAFSKSEEFRHDLLSFR